MNNPKPALLRFESTRGYTLVAPLWPHETLYGPVWTLSRIDKWATEHGYLVRKEATQPKG